MKSRRRGHGRVGAGLLTLSLVVSSLAITLDARADSTDLVVSSSPTRENPQSLTGATLSGNAYIFTTPDTADIQRVRFWIDNPAMTGPAYRTENNAPYDLAGGTVTTANPFDTNTLSDGSHSVTAAIERNTGTDIVTANFTVSNGTTTTTSTTSTSTSSTTSTTTTTVPSGADHDLVVSSSANRANPETLTGATLSGNAYIFTTPDTADIQRVRFWIDNPAMTGPAYRTENNAPYDLAGGTVTTANPFDTNTLSDGSHSVTAAIERNTGTDIVTANFTINNGTPEPEPGPDQIHLSWNGDPTTSFTVVWRTGVAVGSQTQYRALGTSTWTTAAGSVHTTGLTGVFHRVDVNGLSPGTVYEYRVAADDGGWSDIHTTRTVGADGTFRAIYVADTGIAGRTDGLTTGTEAVVSVIEDLDPHLILGGGDYAYFNTETRFPNLDSAIDAWFQQVEPLTSRSSFMTTYGNHEVLLGEGFGPWANRFATPTGVAGPSGVDTRGNYSFDVGPAHFVSITAVHDSQGVSQAQVDWIQQDIAAAKAAGAQWIIPFFHAAPYSDGSNHPSNNALRNQFGPLFEAAGADLAIYSHDQSFERTYPLINASSTVSSATNQPTSTSLTCYEAPNEGVVWLKTSPGGKLSNINGDFSQWLSSTPPAWTAARDNTRHHVTELEVSSEQVVVTTYGIDDDGTRTTQDQFEFTTGTCDGSPPTTTTTTSTTTTSTTTTTTVPSGADHDLVVSSSANRANPQTLTGATLSGNAYIFTTPDTPDIKRVRFWVDNPAMTGPAYQTENNAPYDLAGGTVTTAKPFDTTTLSDGSHSVTAAIERSTGTDIVTANFTVSNQTTTTTTTTTTTEPSTTTTTVPTTTTTTVPSEPSCSVSPPVTEGALPVVALPFSLSFETGAGAVCDGAMVGTGFPYVWPSPNGSGYVQSLLSVVAGELRVETTSGLAYTGSNSQDNALAVGLDPGRSVVASTTLVSPPVASMATFDQAGLWLGTHRFGQADYVKLVLLSRAEGPTVQLLVEQDDVETGVRNVVIPNPSGSTVELELSADAGTLSVWGRFRVDGGTWQSVGQPLPVPARLFTQDQAGIDPNLGTDSFVGLSASHRNHPGPLVFRFGDFSVAELVGEPPPPPPPGEVAFEATVTNVSYKPTSLQTGPDGRLYVLDALGTIRAYQVGSTGGLTLQNTYSLLPPPSEGIYTALGLAFDPGSSAQNISVWVSHSVSGGTDFQHGVANSSTVTRIQNLTGSSPTVQAMITGLPRAIANHAINSIEFGPDGKLYIAMGGQTGGGGPNTAPTEFGTRPEQWHSATLLRADVNRAEGWSPANHGDCATTVNDSTGVAQTSGNPNCDVEFVATGLRNLYDFVFASDGFIYAPDNGLGVAGTVPIDWRPSCQGIIDYSSNPEFDPGGQPDRLQRIATSGHSNPSNVSYHGHPNPARGECVFFNGVFQSNLFGTTVTPPANYAPAIADMNNPALNHARSFNGTIQYESAHFGSALQGQLLFTAFAGPTSTTAQRPQGLYRLDLATPGLPVKVNVVTSTGAAYGWHQPLPLTELSNGRLVAGEFRGLTTSTGRLTVLTPITSDAGSWQTKAPLPQPIADAGADTVGGLLYLVGGKTSETNRISSVHVYNPATDSWTQAANVPGAAREDIAVVAHNGLLYAFGGGAASPFNADTTLAAAYNPSTNTWSDSAVADLPTPVMGAAGAAWSNRIWIIGGMDANGNSTATVRVYDPATNAWSVGPSLPQPRDNAGAAVIDGHLYLFGGRNRQNGSGPTTTDVWRLTSPSGTWETRASMPAARRAFTIGTADGKVQLFGGESPTTSAFTAVHEYSPTNNFWSSLTPMPTGRHGPSGATIAGITYVVGGATTSGANATTTANEAFLR